MALLSKLMARLLGVVVAASPGAGGALSAPAEIPQAMSDVWRDPNAADARRRSVESGDAFYYSRPFQLTAQHIALLRQARFIWDIVESGAPMLHPRAPYGRTDLVTQLKEAFGPGSDEDLAVRHVEMAAALRTLLRHGTLAPGKYTPRPLPPGANDMGSLGIDLSPSEKGIAADGSFDFTDEHRTLLKSLTVDWPNEYDIEDRAAADAQPAAMGDGKRPYGDMSYFFLDMISALGLPAPQRTADDGVEISDTLKAKLQALHYQMLPGVQVFVENAAIEPGVYE